MNRIGLGCMTMRKVNKEKCIETIQYALKQGITYFNTGEFYGAGESEMIVGEALKDIPRDQYQLSVKFGMLPKIGGGLYGIDVAPWNINAHLNYSLHRLGVEYTDIYEPARIDESILIEDIMEAMKKEVEAGYIKAIGLTETGVENVEKALKVTPIAYLEYEYSLFNRSIEENGILDLAKEHHIPVIAFGVLTHGRMKQIQEKAPGLLKIAEGKETTLEKLLIAYVLNKHPEMMVLIGTTSKEHLQDALDASKIILTADEIKEMEDCVSKDVYDSFNMRKLAFKDGKMILL